MARSRPECSLNWGRVGSLGHNVHVLLSDLVRTSEAVSLTSGRRVKIDEIAALLRRAAPEEIPVAVAFLSGELRQRQIGVGYAALGGLLPAASGRDGDRGPRAPHPGRDGLGVRGDRRDRRARIPG